MLKKQAVANEIAASMRENLKPKSCPTTPDKIAEALDKLTLAAQLFDTIGRTKYASSVDTVIFNLQKKLANSNSDNESKRKNDVDYSVIFYGDAEPQDKAAMPFEVKKVLHLAEQALTMFNEDCANDPYSDLKGGYLNTQVDQNNNWRIISFLIDKKTKEWTVAYVAQYENGSWTLDPIVEKGPEISKSQNEMERSAKFMFFTPEDLNKFTELDELQENNV